MSRPGGRIVSALLIAAATGVAHQAIPSPTRAEQAEWIVPRPESARIASLGFDALVSDLYWLQAVQLVGGSVADPSRHGAVLGRLIDVATTLDPWVDHPYRFAAVWMTDSPETVREANRLLERGIAYHPREWRNRFYLGFNRFFYLSENEAAAAVLEEAVHLPGAPVYLPRLVARLRADGAGLETAEAFLRQILDETRDPYARAEYEKALDEVRTERMARLLDQAREEYRRRAGRDIERVSDLVQGPHAVLRALPPEPHGWQWELDPETGRIVSSWYSYRYEPQIHPTDRARRRAWGVDANQTDGGGT